MNSVYLLASLIYNINTLKRAGLFSVISTSMGYWLIGVCTSLHRKISYTDYTSYCTSLQSLNWSFCNVFFSLLMTLNKSCSLWNMLALWFIQNILWQHPNSLRKSILRGVISWKFHDNSAQSNNQNEKRTWNRIQPCSGSMYDLTANCCCFQYGQEKK